MSNQESIEAMRRQSLKAEQRHADHYIKMLMAESASDESLRIEYPNIERAIAGVENGEVISQYTAQKLRDRLKVVRGY